MKTINAAKFKEQCLSILENVEPDGLIVTKHGVPVAKLIPIRSEPSALIGALKGKVRILKDDLFSTGIRWNAES